MKYLALITLILSVSCNCMKNKTSENSLGTNQKYQIIYESAYGGKEEKSYEVFTSLEDFKSSFESPLLNEEIQKTLSTIDFKTHSLVSLHLGLKNTGGYGITVQDVKVNRSQSTVVVKETSPKPGENVTMALTAPFCIAVIEKNSQVIFE